MNEIFDGIKARLTTSSSDPFDFLLDIRFLLRIL